MELKELKQILPNARFHDFQNLEITGISYDSRQVKSGDLFVAIKGAATDGYRFIADALHRGAVTLVTHKKANLFPLVPQIVVSSPRAALASISSYFYGNPSARLKVIGVTGTNGKTTTTYLIKSILEAKGEKVGLLGTIQYLIGDRQIPAPNTTPESYDLQKYFAEMVRFGLNYAVMEVSSHALIQQRVRGTNFHIGLFTNLTRDHLDYHKTITNYRAAKGLLFKGLSEQSAAILNYEDKASNYYSRLTRAKKLWYSIKSPSAAVSARINRMTLDGTSFTLMTPFGSIDIDTSLIGPHNVYNIIAAATVGIACGVPLENIRQGVAAVKSVRGRQELLSSGRGFHVMVDYAHTDDALKNVLAAVKPLVRGRVIVVFGCGGDRDRGKRPLMGKVVAKYADTFVITSDNPRSEDPHRIITDIQKGIGRKKEYFVEPDRYSAIKKAIELARPGDLVLLAGKGHETYQIFRDVVKPFDDRQVAMELLS
ncbi:MAG: UDP-N-acetylmuramoyl-L-alanyl-D-glutamate--2,6-diaminopimelate ligase [Candidatus Brocadiia bacterium]